MKFMLGAKRPIQASGGKLSLSSNAGHDDKGTAGERVVLN